jgi:hypothetical protein
MNNEIKKNYLRNSRFEFSNIRHTDFKDDSITLVLIQSMTGIHEAGKLRRVENTKGVIRIRKSKKNRQHNGQNYKRTNNDLQTLHRKLKIE